MPRNKIEGNSYIFLNFNPKSHLMLIVNSINNKYSLCYKIVQHRNILANK